MKKQRKSRKAYAVYKGDEFIVVGSAKECAKFLDMTVNSFYCLKSRYRKVMQVYSVEE